MKKIIILVMLFVVMTFFLFSKETCKKKFQVAKSLQGPGHDIRDGEIIDQWEGEWGMKEYYAADYWGLFDTMLASNHWEFDDSNLRIRKFKLDLSGFQARIGITYRF